MLCVYSSQWLTASTLCHPIYLRSSFVLSYPTHANFILCYVRSLVSLTWCMISRFTKNSVDYQLEFLLVQGRFSSRLFLFFWCPRGKFMTITLPNKSRMTNRNDCAFLKWIRTCMRCAAYKYNHHDGYYEKSVDLKTQKMVFLFINWERYCVNILFGNSLFGSGFFPYSKQIVYRVDFYVDFFYYSLISCGYAWIYVPDDNLDLHWHGTKNGGGGPMTYKSTTSLNACAPYNSDGWIFLFACTTHQYKKVENFKWKKFITTKTVIIEFRIEPAISIVNQWGKKPYSQILKKYTATV